MISSRLEDNKKIQLWLNYHHQKNQEWRNFHAPPCSHSFKSPIYTIQGWKARRNIGRIKGKELHTLQNIRRKREKEWGFNQPKRWTSFKVELFLLRGGNHKDERKKGGNRIEGVKGCRNYKKMLAFSPKGTKKPKQPARHEAMCAGTRQATQSTGQSMLSAMVCNQACGTTLTRVGPDQNSCSSLMLQSAR